MVILLDLKKHCIETEIKKQYNRLVREILRKKNTDQELMAQKLEFIKLLLETLNFKAMRHARKELAGHTTSTITIQSDPMGKTFLTVDGEKIYPELL